MKMMDEIPGQARNEDVVGRQIDRNDDVAGMTGRLTGTGGMLYNKANLFAKDSFYE